MVNILILDTETTGLEPANGSLIEVGAIYYNVPSRTIMQQVSTLFFCDDNPAYDVNRIPVDALKQTDSDIAKCTFSAFLIMLSRCDAVVAHNAKFDRSWIESSANQQISEMSQAKKWICTKEDFEWPVRPGTPLNLVHIAVAMGVPVLSAHRALTDCHLLAQCFDKINDLPERLAETQLPKERCVAVVSFEDRQLAKDAGFSWNPEAKCWERKMTQKKYEEISAQCSFKIMGFTKGKSA